MACTPIKLTVKDVKAAVAKVKKGIGDKKGTFSGDDTKGSYSFSGDHWAAGTYKITGSYTVSGTTITATNSISAENPNLVTCAKVEEEMRSWLE